MERTGDQSLVTFALIFNFLAYAAITLSTTFIDLIFLSNYPQSMLPLFFAGKTVVILALTFLISPLISKGSLKINFAILAMAGVAALASRFVLLAELDWFPFALALFLEAVAVLLSVIATNTITDSFDLRQYKVIAGKISGAGGLGGLMTGAAILPFISWFGSDSLLYVLFLLMIFTALGIFRLKPLKATGKKMSIGKPPIQYPLFRYVFVGVILLFTMDTFADYALKSELAGAHSKDDIGKFMGVFNGVTFGLVLAIQLGGSSKVLRTWGLFGMLILTPLFCLGGSTLLLLAPGLITAAALRLGENALKNGIDNIGRTISSNPLPASARRSAKLYRKGIAAPIGVGAGAFLLWIASAAGLKGVAIGAIVVCLIWVFMVKIISGKYREALAEMIKVRRFVNIEEDLTRSGADSMRNVAINAIMQDDAEFVKTGLALLEKAGDDDLPDEVLPLFGSPDTEIRKAAVKLTKTMQNGKVTPLLLERLEMETEPNVIWRICDTLSETAPEEAAGPARKHIHSLSPESRAGAIAVLMASHNEDDRKVAIDALREIAESDDRVARLYAARVIGALKSVAHEEHLKALIRDSDLEVSISAIRSIGQRNYLGLIEDLVSKLGHGLASYHTGKALVIIGEPAVPHLKTAALHGKDAPTVRGAIRALALFPDKSVETAIIEVADEGNVINKTLIAKEAALRAKHREVSEEFRARARAFVLQEAEAVKALKSAEFSGRFHEVILDEIAARRHLAEHRLLYWYAVGTKPKVVMEAMLFIFPTGFTEVVPAKRANALELLETIAPGAELRQAVCALEYQPGKPGDDVCDKVRALDDPWINLLLRPDGGHSDWVEMEITQRVIVLRKTRLFSSLPGEILIAVAEVTEPLEFSEGEPIFAEGAESDGFYIVVSGEVLIEKGGEILSTLKDYAFFGEVGMLEGSPRFAGARAGTDLQLLHIDRDVFDSITEDSPEILKAVVKVVLGYLTKTY